VDSPYEIQEELIKKVKREHPLGGVVRKSREKALGYLAKVSLGLIRGFKILPKNDAKM
jgi:hypothetical protein